MDTRTLDGTIPVYRCSLVRERELPERAVRNSDDIAALLAPLLADQDREHFVVILLNGKHKPVGVNVVSIGSLNATITHPREVFKPAILGSAAAIILAHNHPSGDPTPSPEDDAITKRLREAGELLGIRVLDHVVLGDGRHFSYSDAGRL